MVFLSVVLLACGCTPPEQHNTIESGDIVERVGENTILTINKNETTIYNELTGEYWVYSSSKKR